MFIKKKKKKLSVYFFNLRCGLFPFTCRVCLLVGGICLKMDSTVKVRSA